MTGLAALLDQREANLLQERAVGVEPVNVVELGGGEPHPVEHDAVRWLASDELDDVAWLDPDRPFLPLLAAVLRSTP